MINETVVHSPVIEKAIELVDSGWLFIQSPITNATVCELFYQSIFVLPFSEVLCLPNGKKRFCIDLLQPIQWFHSRSLKKLKSIAKRTIFKISRHFREELSLAQICHQEKHGETWITSEFLEQLSNLSLQPSENRCSSSDPQATLELLCFTLLDKTTRKPLASTFGFGFGSVFHDYTMCTFVRESPESKSPGHSKSSTSSSPSSTSSSSSSSSYGTLLTKLVGSVLQSSGYGLWYWGNEVPYMWGYDGGGMMERGVFLERWRELRSTPLRGILPTMRDGVRGERNEGGERGSEGEGKGGDICLPPPPPSCSSPSPSSSSSSSSSSIEMRKHKDVDDEDEYDDDDEFAGGETEGEREGEGEGERKGEREGEREESNFEVKFQNGKTETERGTDDVFYLRTHFIVTITSLQFLSLSLSSSYSLSSSSSDSKILSKNALKKQLKKERKLKHTSSSSFSSSASSSSSSSSSLPSTSPSSSSSHSSSSPSSQSCAPVSMINCDKVYDDDDDDVSNDQNEFKKEEKKEKKLSVYSGLYFPPDLVFEVDI